MMRAATGVAERGRRAAPAVLACIAVISAACAGENLFQIAATGGNLGPEVEITTPTTGLTKALGDSLLVEANVNASNGASSVVYTAVYEESGEDAYTSEEADLNGLVTVSLSNYLRAVPGQIAGTAVVVVSVTDQLGEISADTVTVAIGTTTS